MGNASSWKKAKTSALMKREGGTRKGSPFTQPPPCAGGRTKNGSLFYWCHGERKLLEEGENLCADGTRRGNPQRFPLHTTPSLRWQQNKKRKSFLLVPWGTQASWKKAKTSALMEREGKTRKFPMVLPYCRLPEKPLIFRPDPPKALN